MSQNSYLFSSSVYWLESNGVGISMLYVLFYFYFFYYFKAVFIVSSKVDIIGSLVQGMSIPNIYFFKCAIFV